MIAIIARHALPAEFLFPFPSHPGVAQWLERRSMIDRKTFPGHDVQLTDD